MRSALLGAALTAAAAFACASPRVDFHFDPEEDFSTLRRFTWIPAKSASEQEEARRFPELHRDTRRLIEEKLAAKGYEKVARGSADFLVLHHLSVEHKLETQTLNGALSGSEWEVHRVTEHTVEYEEGTLVIEVLDARLRRLVWRGSAKRRLHRDPRVSDIEKSVAQVLAGFPP